MTQCSECLEALSTGSLADIRPGTAVALHTATCYGCAAALEELVFAEQRLEEALAGVQAVRNPRDLAMAALAGSERARRRRLARFSRIGLAFVAFALVWVFILLRRTSDGEPAPDTMTASITLQCLTPRQAAELAKPYLASDGSAVFRADELRTVTIRGRVDEFVAARNAIARFEKLGSCPPQPAGEPAATATAAGEPAGEGGGSTPDDR